MSTQLIFGNTIHISNMIFIANGKNRQTNLFGHIGQLMGKAERLEKWENGTEKVEVFRKRPKKKDKTSVTILQICCSNV